MTDLLLNKNTAKKSPNKLLVENWKNSNYSAIEIRPEKCSELGLSKGDLCFLNGKLYQTTVAIVLTCDLSDTLEIEAIRINKIMQSNLNVTENNYVAIYKAKKMPNANKIYIRPLSAVKEIEEKIFVNIILSYFNSSNMPIHKGDLFEACQRFTSFQCEIVDIDPIVNFAIATNQTEIYISEDSEKIKYQKCKIIGKTCFQDIGGYYTQLSAIRKIIEFPYKHPKLFKNLGIKQNKGILLCGPSGCGKSLIANTVANEFGAFFYYINGSRIMSEIAHITNFELKKAFYIASYNRPSILFIDNIESIAPVMNSSIDKNDTGIIMIIHQLALLMDKITDKDQVTVIASTDDANNVDPILRRFGRFEKEIYLGFPSGAERLEILRIHTKNMRLHQTLNFEEIANRTSGFTGEDIARLCNDAACHCISEILGSIDMESDNIDREAINSMIITQKNFNYALDVLNHCLLREFKIEKPSVSWSDIGGLEYAKKELQELIMFPLEYGDKFSVFGMNPSKGILLYGPTGCGKTLLVNAVAAENSLNFIKVKGPELLSKKYGESELNIKKIFNNARMAAPCILFFENIDALGKKRDIFRNTPFNDMHSKLDINYKKLESTLNPDPIEIHKEINISGSIHMKRGNKEVDIIGVTNDDEKEAQCRIISQLLNEMDGISPLKNVFIFGATSHPETLDEALIRSGRFDKLIYIPLPDNNNREQIFRTVLRKSPIDDNVNLNFLSNVTDGFSGADITLLCQMASQFALEESIYIDEIMKSKNQESKESMAPTIKRQHFEKAYAHARKSVSNHGLNKFEEFKNKYDPHYYSAANANNKCQNNRKLRWPDKIEFDDLSDSEEEDDLFILN